jgi:hypothetical protein
MRMFRHLVKIAAAAAFLLLLAVPVAFYSYGPSGAWRETVLVAALFALTTYFGHRWMRRVLNIDSPPTSLDARILVGLAFTAVFLAFGNAYAYLGTVTGVILGGLQYSVLTGLLSSGLQQTRTGGWSAWKPGFWKRREYLPAIALMAVCGIALIAAFWMALRWWSFLVVPGMLLGNGLGEYIGRSVRQWLLALNSSSTPCKRKLSVSKELQF